MELVEALWNTTAMLAPYLLVGLVLAGILHVAVPEGFVRRHLSGSGMGPIVRAALAGIPLPLCSCGVIPVAQHLRRDGAGRGATATFVSSTPSTGVDSVSATWGMLGPGFAAVRLLYATISGVLVGWAVDRAGGATLPADEPEPGSCAAPRPAAARSGWRDGISRAWEHGFGEILFSLRKWLLVGIALGALLSWLLPRGIFDGWLSVPVLAYLAMIAASGPLYVCATGSIPIAASLVQKGMSPGAALVFLAVGPATNTATLAFLLHALGKRALAAYLAVVVLSAVAAGALLDLLGTRGWIPAVVPPCHTSLAWWEHASAVVLLVLMFRDFRLPRFRKTRSQDSSMQISIPSISCGNCARHVVQALSPVPGVQDVSVDVPGKNATVVGTAESKALLDALSAAGYPGTLLG
jgi:uncharacterized membrane protein YraQ (UPF0718 family)/copper chaperone CopZ